MKEELGRISQRANPLRKEESPSLVERANKGECLVNLATFGGFRCWIGRVIPGDRRSAGATRRGRVKGLGNCPDAGHHYRQG